MNTAPTGEIYSVSQLNREARLLLEAGLPLIWVSGELSNTARPGSGHIYFTLKDSDAQVRCAMFRSSNRKLKFRPDDGAQVLLKARVSIYEPRGSYQLIVEHMEEAGEGLLRRRFEELKARLADEGLFDESHKLPLPAMPGRIGVITSPSSAAIRDILHVLQRRYPIASIVLYPTRVQGEGAKEEIAAALMTAGRRQESDVLILARGGGSLEDLWAFNEELVARSIHACPIPVVCGVGHEIDFTIADLAADLRAPTPSGAAEIVAPDQEEIQRALEVQRDRLALATQRNLRASNETLHQLAARLARVHPAAILTQMAQGIDDLTQALVDQMDHSITERQWRLNDLRTRLNAISPAAEIRRRYDAITLAQLKLRNAIRLRIESLSSKLAVNAAGLNAVSPLATLERGYAIVQDQRSGKVIRDVGAVNIGDRISARVARGRLKATVDGTETD